MCLRLSAAALVLMLLLSLLLVLLLLGLPSALVPARVVVGVVVVVVVVAVVGGVVASVVVGDAFSFARAAAVLRSRSSTSCVDERCGDESSDEMSTDMPRERGDG